MLGGGIVGWEAEGFSEREWEMVGSIRVRVG